MASPSSIEAAKVIKEILRIDNQDDQDSFLEVLENYFYSPNEGPDSDPEYENEDMDTSVDYGDYNKECTIILKLIDDALLLLSSVLH